MEEMIRLIGAAMVAVMLTVSLRALAPDISALIGAAAGVLLLGYAVYILSPALGELRELAGEEWQRWLTPVLRSLGIAVVAGCGADVCRDLGQDSVASGIELAGKAEIMLVCLPLITELLSLARSLFVGQTVLTAALTVLSVGALLCCGAAAADEPGAGLRTAETTAVYSAASGLSVTLPIQSEPSAGVSITEPSAVASIQAESSAVLSAQAEAEKLTARSAPIGAKNGGESGEPKAHSEVSSMSDASLASGAVGELGSGMLEAMPDYAREAAEGIGSDGRGADSGLLVREAARLLSSMLATVCTDISLLCGGVIIASLFRNVCREGSSRTAVSYAVTLGMAVPSAGIAVRIWSESAEAIENLTMYMRAVIPVMGSLYCAGGNVGAAAASSASLTAAVTLMEHAMGVCLLPVLRVCLGIAIVRCVGGGLCLDGVGSFIRGIFTTGMGLMTVLFGVMMGVQTKLALASDGTAARTVKFAVANMIPVIGGAAGEAMRAVVGSIGTVRTGAGAVAVIGILLTVLPAVIRLLVYRLVFGAAGVLAGVLGAEGEQKIASEMKEMLGYALAMVFFCGVLFIFSVTLMISSSVSITAQ